MIKARIQAVGRCRYGREMKEIHDVKPSSSMALVNKCSGVAIFHRARGRTK